MKHKMIETTKERMRFDQELAHITSDNQVALRHDTRVALFVGGSQIKSGYLEKMFNQVVYTDMGFNVVFLPFVINRGDTQRADELLRQLESHPRLIGANLTSPWKEHFAKGTGIAAGAINFIVRTKDGELEFDAIDGKNWILGLNHVLKRDHHYLTDYDFKGKKIFIYGCGGTAKEIADTLNGYGLESLTLTDLDANRRTSILTITQKLKADYKVRIIDPSDLDIVKKYVSASDIVVNATGSGRGRKGEVALVGLDALRPGQIASELLSSVGDSPFLAAAEKAGVAERFFGREMVIYDYVEYAQRLLEAMGVENIPTAKKLYAAMESWVLSWFRENKLES